MFKHRVQNSEQLPHAGGKCHLLLFTGGAKAQIEMTNSRVESAGDQGCHVK